MYKSLESDQLYVKPLNTEHPDEDLVVYQPYQSIDERMESLAKSRKYYIYIIAKASDISSIPTQSSTSDSLVINNLSQHLDGELPDFVRSSEIASETASNIVVSENQHQPETLQMTSETCTTMIIHLEFNPDSLIISILESSSTDQSLFDTNTSVSEDQAHVVQPINATKPESSLQTDLDTLINKSSVIEHVLEVVIQPAPKLILDISNIDISDSDAEDEHVFHIDGDLGSCSASACLFESNLDTPSSSTTQPNLDLPSISSPQTIKVSPPPTLLLESIVLKEVYKNIF